MTWTDPTTRNTGDLITAEAWNTELGDNLIHLHERVVTLWFNQSRQNAYKYNGAWGGVRINNNATTDYGHYTFVIPEDFDELVSLDLLFIPDSTTSNYQWSLYSDYGASEESKDNHSESAVNQSLGSVTQNELTLYDVSGVFSSLAAGDLCALKVQSVETGTGELLLAGLRLRYTRN